MLAAGGLVNSSSLSILVGNAIKYLLKHIPKVITFPLCPMIRCYACWVRSVCCMCVTVRRLACRLRVFSRLLSCPRLSSQALETPQAQREPVWRDVLLSISLFSFQVRQQDSYQQRHVFFYIGGDAGFTQKGVVVILLVSALRNIYGRRYASHRRGHVCCRSALRWIGQCKRLLTSCEIWFYPTPC